ncbi:MAG: dTMP kinase [Candidatus Roizmanbacteria bacterium]|nr:dTMP kinase [Candidatus Roizmanbacteria bacterium]
MQQGKLIVIEGGDGSGKATQTKLLADSFRAKGIDVVTLSFPRYTDSFYGKLVGRFLAGEFGQLEDTSPYLVSLIYALDREDARDEINSWLQQGKIVIIDRYVPSSLAHQGAKLPPEKREEIIRWIEEMEYTVNRMPVPDIIVYLHVPTQYSLELIGKKAKIREYTHGTDIAENKTHQEKAEEVFQHLARTKPNWHTIECVTDAKLRSIEEIHTEILHILRTTLSISFVS